RRFPPGAPRAYQAPRPISGEPRADGTTALKDAVPNTSYKWAPLADFASKGISNVIPSALNPYLDKMLLLRGLDLLQGTSHGMGMLLGNLASCASKDQFTMRGLGAM